MFPLVYEINTRIWLQKLSRLNEHSVSLGNVPESEFQFFKESGFTMVWLMGVWTPSLYSKSIATSHPGLRGELLSHLSSLQPRRHSLLTLLHTFLHRQRSPWRKK